MKSSTTLWAALALAGALYGMPVNAENSASTLTDADWQEMTENIELENMLDFDINPAREANIWQPLHLHLTSGVQSHFNVEAPFQKHEEVGIAIVDEDGEVVYHTTGKYEDVKQMKFNTYFNLDHTYVVRVYNDRKVHETSVQVIYR